MCLLLLTTESILQEYRHSWNKLSIAKKQYVVGAALRTSLELCKKAPELRRLMRERKLHLPKPRGFFGTEEQSFCVLTLHRSHDSGMLPSNSSAPAPRCSRRYCAAENCSNFGFSGRFQSAAELYANVNNLNRKVDLASEQASSNSSHSSQLSFSIDQLLSNSQYSNHSSSHNRIDSCSVIIPISKPLPTNSTSATMNCSSRFGPTNEGSTNRTETFNTNQSETDQAPSNTSKSIKLPFGIERLLF